MISAFSFLVWTCREPLWKHIRVTVMQLLKCFQLNSKKPNQSPPKQSLISGIVDKLTMRVDLFQMSFSFSLYFLSLWWEAIDQLVAWYMHIFCVRESVLMWLWSMCRGYLSTVSLLLGSVKYWVFKHHLNNQCCLNDLSYPSQVLLHSQHGLFFFWWPAFN